METIFFNGRYKKMPSDISNTTVMAVQVIHKSALSEIFIEKDTKLENGSHYDLPDTMLIVLNLASISDRTFKQWTTCRKWTPTKEEYYRGLIGKHVSIVIEEQTLVS